MKIFRSNIKDKYIWEVNINPLDYDNRRGVDRSSRSRQEYKYDDADTIIIGVANKCFNNRRQILRTFAALYQCYTLEQTQIYLSKPFPKNPDKKHPSRATVQRYANIIIKDLDKNIKDETRDKIKKMINDEYEK